MNMFVDFLSNVSIFSELSEADLVLIEKLFTTRNYPKGSMIILEEEFGDTVFIVVKGLPARISAKMNGSALGKWSPGNTRVQSL